MTSKRRRPGNQLDNVVLENRVIQVAKQYDNHGKEGNSPESISRNGDSSRAKHCSLHSMINAYDSILVTAKVYADHTTMATMANSSSTCYGGEFSVFVEDMYIFSYLLWKDDVCCKRKALCTTKYKLKVRGKLGQRKQHLYLSRQYSKNRNRSNSRNLERIGKSRRWLGCGTSVNQAVNRPGLEVESMHGAIKTRKQGELCTLVAHMKTRRIGTIRTIAATTIAVKIPCFGLPLSLDFANARGIVNSVNVGLDIVRLRSERLKPALSWQHAVDPCL
ncbi:hypothetical protein CHS0354_013666 [Potamilus streckersoni]|uniref:Uncharacterized protein n=1 Tax=Potamilus streckersoni TaxID=2493646 RepID=A0AAE0W2K6_9BIVA|nr:hypothetical protein CHS0354_013666 [Potamilus streckersoni]